MNQSPVVLVLGATGMFGRVAYAFGKTNNFTCYGTARQPIGSLMALTVENFQSDWIRLRRKLPKIDYVINAIGALRGQADITKLIELNALFPQRLAQALAGTETKLIHISTDAVFSPEAGRVTEKTPVSPTDRYGASKYLGEVLAEHVLNIRTSIIGLDPLEHKGLLEQVESSVDSINGYRNQQWSGATVLELAEYCFWLTREFRRVRAVSSVTHLAPISKTSKYELIAAWLTERRLRLKLNAAEGPIVTRYLETDFSALVPSAKSLGLALKELAEFERSIDAFAR